MGIVRALHDIDWTTGRVREEMLPAPVLRPQAGPIRLK